MLGIRALLTVYFPVDARGKHTLRIAVLRGQTKYVCQLIVREPSYLRKYDVAF